jgi:hypothetical protein
MGGVLVKNNDKPPEESILLNQPLDGSDQGKLLIFSLLMVPSVIFIFGVLPIIFLGFGIYMMKKNQDFSSIDTAVLYINNYFKFIKNVIVPVSIVAIWLFFIGGPNFPFTGAVILTIASLLGFGISIAYLKAVNNLFYSPLKRHSEWVAVNGIFSSKHKSDIKSATESEVDIIKAEKLKQYSVADELMKWGKLKEEGHISEDEFNQAKAKLLKSTEKND